MLLRAHNYLRAREGTWLRATICLELRLTPSSQAFKKGRPQSTYGKAAARQTIEKVAKRIGTDPALVRDPESGKASTSVACLRGLALCVLLAVRSKSWRLP